MLFRSLYGAAPERVECGRGVSGQASAAQPPSASSAAKAFSSKNCAAQPRVRSGGGRGFFELDLYGAAPESQPPSASGGGLGFDLDLYSAAPEWFGW